MNYRLLSLLTVLIFPSFTYAQSNFKKGYIVSLTDDTVKGYINYKEWTRTPTQFLFKIALEDASVENYTIHNTRKIVIEGYESYERFVVSVSMNEMDYTKMDPSINPPDKTDTIFLKVITRGDRMALYVYRDELKDRFYVLAPPQTIPSELTFKIELKDGQLSTLNTYRRQLYLIASRYSTYTPELERSIESAPYSEKGLKKIASQVNSVTEKEFDSNIKRYKHGRFFAGAGINYSSLTYKGQNLINANGLDNNGGPAFKDKTTTHSYLPVISAGYDLFFHPAVQRSYLRIEAAATAIQSKVNSLYKFSPPYDEELTNEYKLSGVFLSLTPQLIYNFYQQHNLKIYAGGGLSLRYSFYPAQTFNQHTNKQGQGYSDKAIEEYFKLKSTSVVPVVLAGAIIGKKISVSIVSSVTASEMTDNYDVSKYSSVKEKSVHVSIAYLF